MNAEQTYIPERWLPSIKCPNALPCGSKSTSDRIGTLTLDLVGQIGRTAPIVFAAKHPPDFPSNETNFQR